MVIVVVGAPQTTVRYPAEVRLHPVGSVPIKPHEQPAAGQLLAVRLYAAASGLLIVVEVITGVAGHADPWVHGRDSRYAAGGLDGNMPVLHALFWLRYPPPYVEMLCSVIVYVPDPLHGDGE
jgi:hypothetical protein